MTFRRWVTFHRSGQKVVITLYKSGRVQAEVPQYSLFPSLTFYTQTIGANGTPTSSYSKTALSGGASSYDAKKATGIAPVAKAQLGPV